MMASPLQFERPVMLEIEKVEPKSEGKKKWFEIVTTKPMPFKLDKVGNSPRFLITFKDQPVATAAQYYTLLAHEEVEKVIHDVLQQEGYEQSQDQGRRLGVMQPRPWQRRWTGIIKEGIDVNESIGLAPTSMKWDAGFSVTNSYDLSLALNTELYGFRQLCKNGLYGFGWAREKQLKHVDTLQDPSDLIKRLFINVREVIRNCTDLPKVLGEYVERVPSESQLLDVGRRMNIRIYESKLLEKHGIVFKFEKGKAAPSSVKMTCAHINNELDVINAFTSMANEVNTSSRRIEVQSRIAEIMDAARRT
jgi:hypothetical protein